MEYIEEGVDAIKLHQGFESVNSQLVKGLEGFVVFNQLVMWASLPWETELMTKCRVDKHRYNLDRHHRYHVLLLDRVDHHTKDIVLVNVSQECY